MEETTSYTTTVPAGNGSTAHYESTTEPVSSVVDSVLCGGLLLVYGSTGLVIFSITTKAMLNQAQSMIGFRYLISNALADMFLLAQNTLWPGVVILLQRNVFPDSWHRLLHTYCDVMWFAVGYHYSIVAWTRMDALRRPMAFRAQPISTCVRVCSAAWTAAAVQSVVAHLIPGSSIMYLDPKRHGFVYVSYTEYVHGWTYVYYTVANTTLNLIVPLCFYAVAIYYYFKLTSLMKAASVAGASADGSERRRTAVEVRLMVPCVINNLLFVVGHVAINNPMVSEVWIGLFVLVVFASKSIASPLLYVGFSAPLRLEVARMLSGGRYGSTQTAVAPHTAPHRNKTPTTGAREAGGGMLDTPL